MDIVQDGIAAGTVVIEQPLELSVGVDVMSLCEIDHRAVEDYVFQKNMVERGSPGLSLFLCFIY